MHALNRRTVLASALALAFAPTIGAVQIARAETLEVIRIGRSLQLSASLSVEVTEVELRIASDRNQPVVKNSDVSPLNPMPEASRRPTNNESWFPVVDIDPGADTEGVATFARAVGLYAVNGLRFREKAPVERVVVIPAERLEHWENTIWLEPKDGDLQSFHLRRRLRVHEGRSSATLRLLGEEWGGTLSLHSVAPEDAGRELARTEVARTKSGVRPIPGQGIEKERLLESVAATVGYTLRSHYANPESPFDGGLHLFYDLDARTYRSVHWIWGYGPSVALLLDAARIPEIAQRFPGGELVKVADAIGRMTLRWSENSPIDMMVTSRWLRSPRIEYGYRQALTPADAAFLMGWAWIPLYEKTGDPKYLDASERLAVSIERLCREWDLVPQNYYVDNGTWGDVTIDESGFGTEGFAELFRVTKNERYRELGRHYMEQLIAKLERPDGLWNSGYRRSDGRVVPTVRYTRALGWAMEGLLANDRLDPDGRWLGLARRMGGELIEAQQPEGCWNWKFDRPVAEVGISEKGTALWSLLFFRLHAATGDPSYRDAAEKALFWCLENQYTGPDPEAHGSLVGVNPGSAVGYRPWYRIACTYSSAFAALAALEELKLQSE